MYELCSCFCGLQRNFPCSPDVHSIKAAVTRFYVQPHTIDNAIRLLHRAGNGICVSDIGLRLLHSIPRVLKEIGPGVAHRYLYATSS